MQFLIFKETTVFFQLKLLRKQKNLIVKATYIFKWKQLIYTIKINNLLFSITRIHNLSLQIISAQFSRRNPSETICKEQLSAKFH